MKFVKQSSKLGAMAVAALFVASQAGAQDHTGQTGAGQTPGQTPGQKPAIETAKKGPCVCFASDLVGTKVLSTSGEDIGKIEDVVINPGGEVAYAVLSFGGFMGMGDKLFAVPWSVLQTKNQAGDKTVPVNDKHHKIVLPIEKERLKTAPGFDKSSWPTMATLDWAKDVDTFYRNDRAASHPVEAANRTAMPAILKYSDLKGFNIETPGGDKLGDIKEIAIDMDGRISYAAVSVGGFLGIGDRIVAVPWDALKVTREGDKGDKKKISLATTKDRLEQAPVFKKETQEQMCDPAWIGRVYEFYSVRPYWSTTG